MREIKFRGKRKDNGEWVHGYYYYEFIQNACFIRFANEDYEVVPTSVGEYTGLKDKNKEIYESDIMKLENLPKGIPTNYKVIFENGKFTCAGMEIPYVLDICNGKVIGNIYENKELIK